MKIAYFGEKLRVLRMMKRISQETMAFHLGISQTTYSRIETQIVMPDPQLLAAIARLLDIQVEELLLNPPTIRKEIEQKTAHDTTGKAPGLLTQFVKNRIHKPGGITMIVIIELLFLSVVYDFTHGFCRGLGASQNTITFVSWLSVMACLIVSYLWIKKIKRLAD